MSTARATYRHGDLRRSLIEAGVELAREGGPDAVVLREATRRAGVSPNAAYRHFADRAELVDAVSDAAQGAAAAAIEAELDSVPAATGVESAQERLRAVGIGYLRFARDEPGLFRAAFGVPGGLERAFVSEKAGPGGSSPFALLAGTLDDLVRFGALPEERRPGAELLAWSAVHGLAMLVLEGPLHDLDEQTRTMAGRRVVEMAVRGI
ncbi:TetR/AcrR family transcriptional regulator [Protaetiibacter mangrovi]|uniref:TetR/AcrR family transcriptional regulator n=1 Tax=Protaetiibacter mangrovi TaxID=2970926 RepID=A0ABT1ZIK5_9MICO|nr:TetR/AcrR family transcriptional regulator [Protaetiibacter mangrovi]MCS0500542.1 TetR/AcrR family transcriptional regulator [Protaetiibacter mangrovi]TPX03463.1 TetR/AcrR family transcriptional regulator [Schumannella luteola]